MVSQISNGRITARVKHKGAELCSLYNNALQLEYIWDADPMFWPKTSPVLFPVVGALADGHFLYKGKEFSLPRHGFARDLEFREESKSPSKIVFLLEDNEETRKIYPFVFQLRIIYELQEFSLKITYEVVNRSDEKMFFSIGAHPAFRVPLIEGTSYDDYFLKFETVENSDIWPISKEGLIGLKSESFFKNSDTVPLTKELFIRDALVFKDLKSSAISLRSRKHTHGIDFSFPGFPFFGIWAFKDADFVCLEPWCGIADSVGHNHRIEEKEGIIKLDKGTTWTGSWSVKCY